MALFKKEVCCICGEKAGLLTRQKLADKTYLCGDCVGKCSSDMGYERFERMVKEDVLEHMNYVKENADRYEREFQETEAVHTGILGKTKVVSIDGTHGWWINVRNPEPDIFRFDQICGYELKLDTRMLNEEERRKQHSGLDFLLRPGSGRYGLPTCPPDREITSMEVTVHLNHPWIDKVQMKVMDALLVTDGDIRAGYECTERLFDAFERYQRSGSSAAVSSGTISAAEELKKFKELLDMGAITQEEYEAKKKQLLAL